MIQQQTCMIGTLEYVTALLNASGRYQLGGMLISHLAISLITKIKVPGINLSLGYLWIIGVIFDRSLFNVFAKIKKDLLPRLDPICVGTDIWSSFKFSNVIKD